MRTSNFFSKFSSHEWRFLDDSLTSSVVNPSVLSPRQLDLIAQYQQRVEAVENRSDSVQRMTINEKSENEIEQHKVVFDSVDVDHSIEKRPPTPVIVWRTSAKVKLATDLPSELVEMLMEDPVNESKPKRVQHRSSIMESGPPPVPLLKQKDAMLELSEKLIRVIPKTIHPNYEEKDKVTRKLGATNRVKYGAWYMPIEDWHAEKSVSTSNVDLESDSAVDARLAELTTQIKDLEIAKAYKSYILEQTSREVPVPHYLRNVHVDLQTSRTPSRNQTPLVGYR